MTLSPESTLGELAGRYPATVKVFQRRGIEFCCGGHRTLGEACRAAALSYDDIAAELLAAAQDRPARRSWADRPLAELAEHLVEAVHDPIRRELPVLLQVAARLQGHGHVHRRVLAVVQYELNRMGAELPTQMHIEARELFPLVSRLERHGVAPGDRARLDVLVADARACHTDVAQTLRILRQITDGYTPPSAGCSTLRALYRGLEELEALLQLHVHLETNVLFSRAAALISGAGMENLR